MDYYLPYAAIKIPIEVYKARDYMLVYENEADVRALSPNFLALANIDSLFAVIATAPGHETDFVSRFFLSQCQCSWRSCDRFSTLHLDSLLG